MLHRLTYLGVIRTTLRSAAFTGGGSPISVHKSLLIHPTALSGTDGNFNGMVRHTSHLELDCPTGALALVSEISVTLMPVHRQE